MHSFCNFASIRNINHITLSTMSEALTLPDLPTAGFALIDLDLLEPNEGQLDGVPANPREITSHKFELLKQNILKYPKFLKYNMTKVLALDNGHYIIVDGNMRYRAITELGIFKQIPCAIIDPETPVEEIQAYVALANSNFGRWEWQMIANEWDAAQMMSWGVDIPTMEAPDQWDALDEINDNLEDPNLTKDPRFAIVVPHSKRDIIDALKSDIKQLIADTPIYEGVIIKSGKM